MRYSISLGVLSTVVAGALVAGLSGASAHAGAPRAGEAIERTGVLPETEVGQSFLEGNSLAEGVTVKPAASALADSKEHDADAVVANDGSRGLSLSVALPDAVGSLQPQEKGARDESPAEAYARTGFVTGQTRSPHVEAGVQSLADGFRLMTVIKSPEASGESRYRLSLPPGATLEQASPDYSPENPVPDGEIPMTGFVIVSAQDEVLGGIDAPWAVDASGKSLPTKYRVEGDDLIQTVDHAGAAYPVVADPKVSFGWWIYVRWNRGEVKKVRDKIAGGVAAGTAICNVIPNEKARAVCLALSGYTLLHLGTVFTKAAEKKCKVEVKWKYSPLYKTKTYACKKK
ncbi:hypothetical protein GL263_23755 [Streptomyces durbertensis]|uniref:Uncharacterized protein n=1 Tax=Streptomyces durbertensis TaxID=2448886 RepID=A0ABR6EN91_9ACTN|nr:hypothetical protein [Streptomyces durbertensis]MBB1246542.1 hypothetical protein [Streptomyces durbertensis]